MRFDADSGVCMRVWEGGVYCWWILLCADAARMSCVPRAVFRASSPQLSKCLSQPKLDESILDVTAIFLRAMTHRCTGGKWLFSTFLRPPCSLTPSLLLFRFNVRNPAGSHSSLEK